MSTVKLYASAVLDMMLILMATLADLDLEIRIAVGLAGLVLSVLTCIKFVHDIKLKRIDGKLKKLELDRKEEDFRRYMQAKHTK